MTITSANLGYGSNTECRKSTPPAITLPDHSAAMYNVKCGRPQEGGLVEQGDGGRKIGHFEDILHGHIHSTFNQQPQTERYFCKPPGIEDNCKHESPDSIKKITHHTQVPAGLHCSTS